MSDRRKPPQFGKIERHGAGYDEPEKEVDWKGMYESLLQAVVSAEVRHIVDKALGSKGFDVRVK
jgi:hypothetical protein